MLEAFLILLLAWRIKKAIEFVEWSVDRYEKRRKRE